MIKAKKKDSSDVVPANYIDQRIALRLHRRQRVHTASRTVPEETFSIFQRYPLLSAGWTGYVRCVITGGTICYAQYVFAALPRAFPHTSIRNVFHVNTRQMNFGRRFAAAPISKVSSVRAFPRNLVYLRIVFIRVCD